MTKHALLSASGAERWLQCPPSARFSEKFPDTTSVYASEGSFAHKYAEAALIEYFYPEQMINITSFDELRTHKYWSRELQNYIVEYCTYVVERSNVLKVKADSIFLEQRVDFSKWVPEGFGTADVILVGNGTLEIIDLKYGKGVPVDAKDNPQIKLYALGALESLSYYDTFTTVSTVIYQPRIDNISVEKYKVKDLIDWANNYVSPQALLAHRGDGKFKAGEHCRFCKAKFACRERARDNLGLIKYDFASPHLLKKEEIIKILDKAENLKRWVADIQLYAQDLLLRGKKLDGWKLVEGRSIRKYVNEEKIIEVLLENNYTEEDIFHKTLIPIPALEVILGKEKLTQLVGKYIEKPIGKSTLVRADDRRPELMPCSSAKLDFAENIYSLEKIMEKPTNNKLNKVVTGEVRLSFAYVFEPHQSEFEKEAKYSTQLLIPKSDTRTVEKINTAIRTALENFYQGKTLPKNFRTPIRDGDLERANDPNYANCYFLSCKSKTAPEIVDKNLDPILDKSEVYSGCYCRVSLNFYAYETAGNKGVACGLLNIQKLRDGEHLGSKTSAYDDFGAYSNDDMFL